LKPEEIKREVPVETGKGKMVLESNVRSNVKPPVLLTLIAIGLLLGQVGFAEVSLQEVYNNAGPGGGYDKLLELDPQEIYIGDLWITGPYHEVSIRGNGVGTPMRSWFTNLYWMSSAWSSRPTLSVFSTATTPAAP